MNNKRMILILIIIFLSVLSLVIYNFENSKDLNDYYKEKVLTINLNGKRVDKISFSNLQNIEADEFEIYYKRKVGNPVLKKYTGVEIKKIFKELKLNIDNIADIEVTSVDNFLVTISAAEILKDRNVYIVYKDNDTYLDDNFGPYMIVIKDDDIATRWGKCVVNINIKEKK